MKRLIAAGILMMSGSPAMAATGDLPENHALAGVIARGVEKRPITSAVDAEDYASRITTATYGEAQTRAQLPFHANADGDRWKVIGSRPMDLGTMTGPLTIVVRKEDGTVQEMLFTAAPADWDAAILAKLGRKPSGP